MEFLYNDKVISGFESISPAKGLLALLLTGLTAYLVETVYRSSSSSHAGGRQIAVTIVPLSLGVCIIIAVVKGSLALSLGLVGALSVVRFRTPVKDPEDLLYLFLAIVTGLGFGAGQFIYTPICVSAVCALLFLRSARGRRFSRSFDRSSEVSLQVSWPVEASLGFDDIVNMCAVFCSSVNLLQYNKSTRRVSLKVQVNVDPSHGTLTDLINSISALKQGCEVSISNSSIDW